MSSGKLTFRKIYYFIRGGEASKEIIELAANVCQVDIITNFQKLIQFQSDHTLSESVGLLIVDIRYEPDSGKRLLYEIKQFYKTIPLAVVCDELNINQQDNALFNDIVVLNKPYDIEEISRRLVNVLSKSGQGCRN